MAISTATPLGIGEIVMSTANQDHYQLAEKIRQACLQTALTAYEDARMDGLCHQGAWESAMGALQQMDIVEIVNRLQGSQPRQG
jgi:hypothetical protein